MVGVAGSIVFGSGLTGQTLRLVCAGRRLHSTLDGVRVGRTGPGRSIANSSILHSLGLRLDRVLGSRHRALECARCPNKKCSTLRPTPILHDIASARAKVPQSLCHWVPEAGPQQSGSVIPLAATRQAISDLRLDSGEVSDTSRVSRNAHAKTPFWLVHSAGPLDWGFGHDPGGFLAKSAFLLGLLQFKPLTRWRESH